MPSTREKLRPTPLAEIVRLPVIWVPRIRLLLPDTVTLPSMTTRPPSAPSPNSVTRLPAKSMSPVWWPLAKNTTRSLALRTLLT